MDENNSAAAAALEDLIIETDDELCWSVDSDFRLIAERLASLTLSDQRMRNYSTPPSDSGSGTTSDLQPVIVIQPTVTASTETSFPSDVHWSPPSLSDAIGSSSSVSSPVTLAAGLRDNWNSNARISDDHTAAPISGAPRPRAKDGKRHEQQHQAHSGCDALERSPTSISTPSSIASAVGDHGKDGATVAHHGRRAAGPHKTPRHYPERSISQRKPRASRSHSDDHRNDVKTRRLVCSYRTVENSSAEAGVGKIHTKRSGNSADTRTSSVYTRWSSSATSAGSSLIARHRLVSSSDHRTGHHRTAKDRRRNDREPDEERREPRSRHVLKSSPASVSTSSLDLPQSKTSSSVAAVKKTSSQRRSWTKPKERRHGAGVTYPLAIRCVGVTSI